MAYNTGPTSRTRLGDSEENSQAKRRSHEGDFQTEYTGSSDNRLALEKLLTAIEKRGAVTLHITRCILIGPPRVGKSCFKNLLVHNKPFPVIESAPVMEAPVVLTSMWTQQGKEGAWKELTRDDFEKLVNKCAMDENYFTMKIEDDNPTAEPLAGLLKNEGRNSIATADQPTVQLKPSPIKLAQTPNPLDSELPTDEHPQAIASPQQARLHKPNPVVPNNLSQRLSIFFQVMSRDGVDLNNLKLIHVFDCGGQLAFQDTIPLLINAPCAFIAIFNAFEDLDKEIELTYCLGGEELPTGHKETQWNMLLSIFSSIQALQYKCHQDLKDLIKEPSSHSFPIAVVGTHKDKIVHSDIDRIKGSIESKLSDLSDSNPCFFIQRKGQILNLVGNLTTNDLDQVEPLRKDISDNATFSLDLPIPWLLLELFTRSRLTEQAFYPYSELKELCRSHPLRMEEDDFDACIRTLHILGFYAFYPLRELFEDENWICTDAATLYKEVSKLLMVQHVKAGNNTTARFQKTGRIPLKEEALKELFKDLMISIRVDRKWLMHVLLHLGLAAKIKMKRDSDEEDAFIPLALPPGLSDIPSKTSVAPLCFTLDFTNEDSITVSANSTGIPRGTFSRLVVLLLCGQFPGYVRNKWKICDEDSKRSCIKFSLFDYSCHVYLKESMGHIEASVVLAQGQTMLARRETDDNRTREGSSLCQDIRKTLTAALQRAFELVFDTSCQPKVVCGFACSECDSSNGYNHLAIIREPSLSTDELSSQPEYMAVCVFKKGNGCCLTPDQLIWFNPQDQQTMQPSATPVEDQRTLALTEAHKMLKRYYTKPTKRKHFVNLALVERLSKVDKAKKDVKEFLEATAHGIDRYTAHQKTFEYKTILASTGSDSGKRVLINGPPGSGKTTLAHQLCWDLYSGHLPNQYQLVLFTELKAFRSYTNKENKEASLLTLLEYLGLPESDSLCFMIEKEEGRGVAIILDGYDEISDDDSCKTLAEWVSEVFCDRYLPVSECDVFITTRPSQLSQLVEVASVHWHLEILGFSSSNIECYIKAYFKGAPDKAEEVIRRLTDLPLVRGLCSNPRALEIACKILKHQDEEPLPANLSGIFLRYLCYQLEVDLKDRHPRAKTMIKDLLNVPNELFPGFYTLCSLAYYCCLRQQLMLENHELGEVNKYINNRGSVYNLLFGKEVDSLSAISCMLYQCDHRAVMEALAAVHIAVLSPAEQQQIWEEWFTAPHMAQVWMMYCGLTGLKSVDLKRLCSLIVSERNREVSKDLRARAFQDVNMLVMVSLFEASNDDEAKRVLPVLLKNTIIGGVESQYDVLVLAYSITHHPHLSRVRLDLPEDCSELGDLKPLTTSLRNVKAVELRCFQIEPMLAVLPSAVIEELALDFDLEVTSSAKGNISYKGLGDALRDCHCLRSLIINSPPDSTLWTELDSVLNSNRLTEFHMEDNIYAPSTETLENLLFHREKCSLTIKLNDHQISAVLSGLKGADNLKELDLQIDVSSSEANPDQWLVTCAEVEELVATHPHLVKVQVKSYYRKNGLLKAVAKGAIRNKNITHLGLGRHEICAVHPLLCSPSADHITSISAEYGYDYDGDDDDVDAWSKGMIAGPMARQTCHLHLEGFTLASLGLLFSRVNTATKLKDLSLKVDYLMDDDDENQPLMDVRAVETAFSKCYLRKLRIKHGDSSPAQWCRLYSAILKGLAANTTTQVDSCIYGYQFDVEEITRHLSQQTLYSRFDLVRADDWTYIISRDPSCPSAPVPGPGPLLNVPSQHTSPEPVTTPSDPPPSPPEVGELLEKYKHRILSEVMPTSISLRLQMEKVIDGRVAFKISKMTYLDGNCLIFKHLMEQSDLKSLQTFSTVLAEEEGNAMQRLGKELLDHQSLQKFEAAKSFERSFIISRDPSCPSGHESVLLDKCFISFGIKTVQIDQSGGAYCLEPTTDGVEDPHSDDSEQQRSGGDGDEGTQLPEGTDEDGEGMGTPQKSTDIGEGREEENRFKIEVPDGALKQEFLEVRSAIIFSGPWRLPKGYTLASPVLYISFDWTAVTEPIIVRVPHWIAQVSSLSAEDCPLVTAPHELPEDDSEYSFSFLDQENCSVGARHSTIKLSGHCCLLAQAIKESKGQSRYSANAWTRPRESGSGYLFRVPVIFSVPIWKKVLEKYFKAPENNWTKCNDNLPILFEFATGKLSGNLSKESGPGWTASLNYTRLPKSDVQAVCRKKADTLEYELEENIYPPSFTVTVNECSREQDTESMSVSLVVSGTTKKLLTFSFPVKQAVHLSETDSLPSLRSPPTASRNGSPVEGPHSSPGDAPIEDVAFFLAYIDKLMGDLTTLGVVLGLSEFTPPGDSPSDKCTNTLKEWLKRTASPTVGKFCQCLEKAPSFNNLRENILRSC